MALVPHETVKLAGGGVGVNDTLVAQLISNNPVGYTGLIVRCLFLQNQMQASLKVQTLIIRVFDGICVGRQKNTVRLSTTHCVIGLVVVGPLDVIFLGGFQNMVGNTTYYP